MKCFYHNDLDGEASAFCVGTWAGISGPHDNSNCMHKITYGDKFPFEIILPGEQVWIVDYSIQPEEMERLLSITEKVTWIDHHKTAIEKYENFPHKIRGIRKDGEAGCVLTWKYLHWYTSRGEGEIDTTKKCPEGLEVPRMIQLVGDRDIWKWEFGDETKHFFSGSGIHDTSPDSDFWLKCMEHEVNDLPLPNTGNRDARIRGEKFWKRLLRDGETIEKYKAQIDRSINSIGFDCEFEGYKCFIINRPRCASNRLGDRIEKYDIVMPFYFDGKKYTISLYSNKVDVSLIAKKYGGGGHKGAAGFQCKELPFNTQ